MFARVSTVFRVPLHPTIGLTCARASPQLSSFVRALSSTAINNKKLNAAIAYKAFNFRRKRSIFKLMKMDLDPATENILKSEKYPAKKHAENVAKFIKEKHPEITDGLIYLESAKEKLLEDSDSEAPFRQRRYFYYLSGCDLADSYLTYSISTCTLTLYIPPISPSSVLWCGLPLSIDEAKKLYDVDTVRYTTPDLYNDLSEFASSASSSKPIFAIANQISNDIPPQVQSNLHTDVLKTAIEECRAIKDSYEVALIRKANAITTSAHHRAMNAVKHVVNEREVEAVFTERCIAGGAPKQAYHGIYGSGRAAATLHYVKNNASLAGKLNLLLDAGAEYDNYASDVTRTYPINGEFSPESLEVYNLVLAMQKATIDASKAEASWDDIHTLAHRIAIEGLLKVGILKGGSVDEILENRTSCAFFPHGLGHLLGMDTHDTGGHPNYKDEDKMFFYLRKRGALRIGEVITVEPGIYFCEFIIKPYLEDPKHSKYIDKDVLDKYWDVGGVRIEDNILITETGHENLTTTFKEIEDMYKLINDK